MSKKVEKRECAICGKKFTPKTANALVCGDKCRKALKQKNRKPHKPQAKCVEKIKIGKPQVKKSTPKTVRAKDVIPEPLVAGVLKLIDTNPRVAIAFGKAVVDTAIKSIGKKMFDTLLK